MTAYQDCFRLRIASFTARKHIANLVDANSHSGIATPPGEKLTPEPVFLGQRKTPYATLRGCADFRHFRETRL